MDLHQRIAMQIGELSIAKLDLQTRCEAQQHLIAQQANEINIESAYLISKTDIDF